MVSVSTLELSPEGPVSQSPKLNDLALVTLAILVLNAATTPLRS